jgi:hypothetical protein
MASRKSLSTKDMNGQKITNLGVGTANTTDAASTADVETARLNAISRANHTGTQLSSTISDFDTQVRTSRLDQMAAPTNPVSMGSQRITSVTDPTGAQDAATKNYVDTQLAGAVSGLTLKGTVRAAATANITISSPGTTIDGITASNGDLFLLTAQTTGSQNGPYVFNGSGSAMTRATNWDTSGEATLGSYWIVREGTNADKFAILTNDTAITLGTTTPTFAFSGLSTATSYTETNPTTSAGGSWTVTHSLGTKAVLVQVWRTASPFDDVDVYFERTSTSAVTIKPDTALTTGDYSVVVKA